MTALENTTVQAPPRTLSERLARFVGRAPVHLILSIMQDAGLANVEWLEGAFYQPLLVGTVR